MTKSARIQTIRNKKKPSKTIVYTAKGAEASRLRQRRSQLARRFQLPDQLLGGSLNQVARRCGKSTCHCASSDAHPMWTLTYSIAGKKHVEFIPEEWVAFVQPLAKHGKAYRDALREILDINARLLSLWRKQQRATKNSRRPKGQKNEGHR